MYTPTTYLRSRTAAAALAGALLLAFALLVLPKGLEAQALRQPLTLSVGADAGPRLRGIRFGVEVQPAAHLTVRASYGLQHFAGETTPDLAAGDDPQLRSRLQAGRSLALGLRGYASPHARGLFAGAEVQRQRLSVVSTLGETARESSGATLTGLALRLGYAFDVEDLGSLEVSVSRTQLFAGDATYAVPDVKRGGIESRAVSEAFDLTRVGLGVTWRMPILR